MKTRETRSANTEHFASPLISHRFRKFASQQLSAPSARRNGCFRDRSARPAQPRGLPHEQSPTTGGDPCCVLDLVTGSPQVVCNTEAPSCAQRDCIVVLQFLVLSMVVLVVRLGTCPA